MKASLILLAVIYTTQSSESSSAEEEEEIPLPSEFKIFSDNGKDNKKTQGLKDNKKDQNNIEDKKEAKKLLEGGLLQNSIDKNPWVEASKPNKNEKKPQIQLIKHKLQDPKAKEESKKKIEEATKKRMSAAKKEIDEIIIKQIKEVKKDNDKIKAIASNPIILVKETPATSNKTPKKEEIQKNIKKEKNISELVFSSSTKMKDEILRKNDSYSLLENNNQLVKIIGQLKSIADENKKILEKFKDVSANHDNLSQKQDEPRDIMNYKVIEVTENKQKAV
ncbi:hypothetical protein NUSPORA_00695 [Nucleospora cyclopteri]